MSKFSKIVVWVTIIVAWFLMLLVGFWLLYPYKPLVIKDPLFPIVNKIVKQGKNIQFISDNCKNTNLTSKTSRAFVDDIIYYVHPITTNVRKGCGKVIITVPVPDTLPPGKYYLQNIFEYKVNPIRVVSVTHNTENFLVVE
jgi:hypothetical protein